VLAEGLSRAAAERVLRLSALAWSGAWMVSMTLALANDPGITTSAGWTIGCLLVLLSAWLLLAFRGGTGAVFVAVAAGTAMVQAATVAVSVRPDYFVLAAPWATIATVGAALLLPRRRAVIVVVAVSSAVFAILTATCLASSVWPVLLPQVVDTAVRALVNGMAIAVGSRELRAAASIADVEGGLAADRQRESTTRHANRAAVRSVHRTLHDTFVNTLAAIRAGAGVRSAEAVRNRCRQDVAAVRFAMARDAPDRTRIDDLVRRIRETAAALSIEVDVQSTALTDAQVPATLGRALTGVVHESLVNVAKHSGAERARIEVMLDDDQGLRLRVHDTGTGWSGTPPEHGGIAESIIARVAMTGGVASVRSRAGASTTVDVEWSPVAVSRAAAETTAAATAGDLDRPHEAEVRQSAVLRRAYAEGGLWLCVLVVAGALTPGSPLPPAATLAAVLLSVGSLPVVLHGPWPAPVLPTGLIWVLALLIVPVAVLPEVGWAGCPASNGGSWGLDGALVLILALCLLGGNSAFPVVLAVLAMAVSMAVPLLMDPLRPAACSLDSLAMLVLECGSILGLVLFHRLLMRYLDQAERERRSGARIQAEQAADMAGERSRAARFSAVLGRVGPFLEAIADERLDPADPVVRVLAGEQETALRSLLALDPGLGALGDVFAEALVDAAVSGRAIDIRSGERVGEPDRDALGAVAELLGAAVSGAPVGGTILITLLGRDSGGAMMMVLPTADRVLADGDVDRLGGRGLTVHYEVLDDETLVEVSWLGS
jgi:signal transduction histidine kinase